MKKSQITGEVFVYIIAAILFALIVSYGYKAINSFLHKSEQVALIDFSNNLKVAVDRIAASSDVEKLELLLPSKYRAVCFVDTRKHPITSSCPDSFKVKHPIAYNSWEDGASQNVFLEPHASMAIDVGPISLPSDCICINVSQGKLVLRLQGTGDSTLITEWR